MKKEYLPIFSLLKLIAVIGILCCHSDLIPDWDACARMVEILFITSGFLMAYNHYNDKKHQTGWQIICRKLPRFYPIHIFAFLLQALFVTTWASKPLSYFLSVGILNLSLQQAWFVGTEFSYNNVSWFLSALLFCYAVTPVLKRIITTAECKKFGLLYVFAAVCAIRLYIDYLAINAARFAPIDLHCNPFVQMLNYSLGYITAVFTMRPYILNSTLQKTNSIQLSVLQTLTLIVYLLCCQRFVEYPRPFFIFLALPLVYMLSFNCGLYKYIGQLSVIRYLSGLTLEIFMLHSFILYHLPTSWGNPLSYLRFFAVTLIAAILYHHTYKIIVTLWHKKRAVK